MNYEDLKDADVVIEAVFEDLPLKHKIIKQVFICIISSASMLLLQLEAHVPEDCIIGQ